MGLYGLEFRVLGLGFSVLFRALGLRISEVLGVQGFGVCAHIVSKRLSVPTSYILATARDSHVGAFGPRYAPHSY